MRIPGCRRQRELRGWSLNELAEHAQIHRVTAGLADRGEDVRPQTFAAIAAAFERHPASPLAAELLTQATS